MAVPAVQRANTFFQSEQTFVDLGAFQPRLAVVFGRVRAALGPREVDERELAVDRLVVRPRFRFQTLRDDGRGNATRVTALGRAVGAGSGSVRRGLFEHELHDGVRPAGLGVGAGGAHAPRRRTVRDELLDQADVRHLELLQTHDAHLRARVLANHQPRPPVEEVVHLASVNLKEGDVQAQRRAVSRRSFARSPPALELTENLAGGADRQRVHRVRLPRAGLPVREAGDFALIERRPHERRDRRAVHLVVGRFGIEHVVEVKRVLLRVLGQINLGFRFPHRHARCARFTRCRLGRRSPVHRDDVILLARALFGVERALAHHHADARLVRWERRERRMRVRVDESLGVARLFQLETARRRDERRLRRIRRRRSVFVRVFGDGGLVPRRTRRRRVVRSLAGVRRRLPDGAVPLAAQPAQLLQRCVCSVCSLGIVRNRKRRFVLRLVRLLVVRGRRRELVLALPRRARVRPQQRAQQKLVVLGGVHVHERHVFDTRRKLRVVALKVVLKVALRVLKVLDEPEQRLLMRDVDHAEVLEIHHAERRELALGRAREGVAVLAQAGAAQPLAHASVRGRGVAVVPRQHGGDGHREPLGV